MDSFDIDQILSIFLGEISRPNENGHLITEALARVAESYSKYNKDGPKTFQTLAIKWIIMCLENFVQLTCMENNYNQALYNLACFFLISCDSATLPFQKQLLFDIFHSELEEEVIEEIFLISGVAFSKLLTTDSLQGLAQSFLKIGKEPYLTLVANIQ